MVSTSEIQLGADYEDVVTGFVGTAISRVTYLSGCDRVGLQPSAKKVDDYSKVLESMYFDYTCLRLISQPNAGIAAMLEAVKPADDVDQDDTRTPVPTGGPREAPKGRPDPA